MFAYYIIAIGCDLAELLYLEVEIGYIGLMLYIYKCPLGAVVNCAH
jgi:hypothetical protein